MLKTPPRRRDDAPAPNRVTKPTPLRASAGGVLIPTAVIGAIAAFETARTTDASREVFFNISYPAIMYFVFAAFVAIVAGAFVQRLRIWRIGKGQGVGASFGARLTNMLTMGAFTSRVKNDRYAGVMHWCIYPSFMVLPGLRLVPAPGHTPGTQVVVVESGRCPVLVGGDVAVWFGELEEPQTEGQLRVRALDPELVWLAHEPPRWASRSTGRSI